jgi:hypothetical protein
MKRTVFRLLLQWIEREKSYVWQTMQASLLTMSSSEIEQIAMNVEWRVEEMIDVMNSLFLSFNRFDFALSQNCQNLMCFSEEGCHLSLF